MHDTDNFRKKQGAIYQSEQSRASPLHFGNPQAEALCLRKSIGLIERYDLGLLTASGPDAAEYLHLRLTHSVTNLAQGQGRSAAMLEAKGRLLASLQIYRHPPGFWILTERALTENLHNQMSRFLFSKDAAFENQTEHWAMLHLIGPRATDLLGSYSPHWAGKKTDNQALQISHDPETHCLNWDIGRVPGYLIITKSENSESIWEKLLHLAKEFDGGMAGTEAFDTLHVEEGLAQYGYEWDEKTIPLDVGMRNRIDFQKGCYPGQEIIARITNLGQPSKKLVGLRGADSEKMTSGDEVFIDEKRVGRITSTAYSPSLGSDIALAIVRRKHGETGTILHQAEGGKLRVCTLPFDM